MDEINVHIFTELAADSMRGWLPCSMEQSAWEGKSRPSDQDLYCLASSQCLQASATNPYSKQQWYINNPITCLIKISFIIDLQSARTSLKHSLFSGSQTGIFYLFFSSHVRDKLPFHVSLFDWSHQLQFVENTKYSSSDYVIYPILLLISLS